MSDGTHTFASAPEWFRKLPAHPPPPDGPVGKQVAWLTGALRPYCGDLAAWVLFGEVELGWAEDEAELAASGLALHAGMRPDVARVALAAARTLGERRAAEFAEALRRAIRPLARQHAGGPEIMAAANVVNERFGTVLPSPMLLRLTKEIGHAAVWRPRHVRR